MKPTLLLLTAALLSSSAALAGPRIWREPTTGMPFVALSKGCFQMGTKTPVLPHIELPLKHLHFKGSSLSADEQPQHEVCLDAFLIGQFEVRADDWFKVMGSNPPEGSGQEPAGGISWDAAQEFAQRLTQQSGGKHQFRLPTEAEWEYACRAGAKKELVPYQEHQIDAALYSIAENHPQQPGRVGLLKANAWGLHDMLGNVWEWVEDGYRADGYAAHSLFNPLVKESPAGERVIRGASHRSGYVQVRCAKRGFYAAHDALGQIGLRLVRTPR